MPLGRRTHTCASLMTASLGYLHPAADRAGSSLEFQPGARSCCPSHCLRRLERSDGLAARGARTRKPLFPPLLGTASSSTQERGAPGCVRRGAAMPGSHAVAVWPVFALRRFTSSHEALCASLGAAARCGACSGAGSWSCAAESRRVAPRAWLPGAHQRSPIAHPRSPIAHRPCRLGDGRCQ